MKKLLALLLLTTSLSATSINFIDSSVFADKTVHISSSSVFADKELCIPDNISAENAVAAAVVLGL